MLKHFIIIISISLFTLSARAQSQTQYEKRCYSLTVQFLEKLGVDKSLLKKNINPTGLEILLTTSRISEKLNTESGLMLFEAYKRQLKEAEKLKTSLDFQREKRKKETDLKKSPTDYAQIKNDIKKEYDKWLQKSEFEKNEEYQNRIKNSSSEAFDSICFKDISNKIKQKDFLANFLKYNAEAEKFGIEISIRGGLKLSDSIYVPSTSAVKFKELAAHGSYIYAPVNDWSFVANYLKPIKITIVNYDGSGSSAVEYSYELIFKSTGTENIYLSSSELNIKTPNGKDFNFDYNEYYHKHPGLLEYDTIY